MLALVAIFLTALLIAVVVVWLSRLILSWKGVEHLVGGVQTTMKMNTMKMKLSGQQGYISLNSRVKNTSQEPSRVVKLRTVRGGVKAPWGW